MPIMLTKAMIKVEGGAAPFSIMFNPNEYTISRGDNRSNTNIPGNNQQDKQYISGENDVLVLELFYDTYSTGTLNALKPEALKTDVRDETKKIYDLMDIKEHLHAPPKVTFLWGKFKFEGFIKSVEQKFTMFTFKGVPVRAFLKVAIEGQEAVGDSPTSSPDRTKSHMITEGEQLWQLAQKEYCDPSIWRKIAEANGIENPRIMRNACTLKIPSI